MRLDKLPEGDPESGDKLAVVETPKGSRNKYDYDPELRALRLAGVLPGGMVFPYDFGFFPSTKADDGDPVDVLILLDEPAVPGCVLPVRVIGAIEAEQRKEGGEWVQNNRILAVASHSHVHSRLQSIDEVNPATLDEIEAFFDQYNRLKNVEFRVTRRSGPKRAEELIDRDRL
jgi:inorganic pyrophosphatase